MKKLIFLTVTLFIANFSFGQWGGQFKFLTEEFYSSILSFGGVYGFDVNLESFELQAELNYSLYNYKEEYQEVLDI